MSKYRRSVAQETRANTEKSPKRVVQFSMVSENSGAKYATIVGLSVYPSPTQPSFVYAVSTLPINCCCFFFLFSNSLRSSRDCYARGTSLAAGPGGIFKSVEAVSCSQSSCSSAPAKTLPYPLPHANYNNKDSTRRLNPPATHAIFIVKLSKVLTLYVFP